MPKGHPNTIANITARLVAVPGPLQTPCLIWPYARTLSGYGKVKFQGRLRSTHAVLHEAVHGPIPDGMQRDHLCRNTLCANVEHLEVVTPRENVRRSNSTAGINARKTHCVRGHAFDELNTFINANGARCCRTCMRAADAARRQVAA